MEIDNLVASSQNQEDVILENRRKIATAAEKALEAQLVDEINKEDAYVSINLG